MSAVYFFLGSAMILAATALPIRAGGPALDPTSTPPVAALSAASSTAGRVLDDATVERLIKLQEQDEITVRSVLVPAAVEDRRGRIVRGLAAADFVLYENRVPQRIQSFWIEGEEPVSIAFLLDVSGSMRQSGKLAAAKEAIRHFVTSLRNQDRFALICFADEQVSWVTEFTSDRARFLERLEVQEGYGQTALHDAVASTPRLVDEKAQGRKAVLLITDGVDNASRLTAEQALVAARKVEVPIYTVGISSIPNELRMKGEVGKHEEIMRRFSEETGGALFVVHDPDELKESVVRVNEELRYQYLLAYQPSAGRWDGSFRSIRLETRSGRHVVRTRRGYYANP
jgi:Ca-activated chloride channel family protein